MKQLKIAQDLYDDVMVVAKQLADAPPAFSVEPVNDTLSGLIEMFDVRVDWNFDFGVISCIQIENGKLIAYSTDLEVAELIT